MAGTRGLAKFRGEQLKNALMRDSHFDVNNKINENKVDITWLNHKEVLEATKIDVWLQVNNKVASGVNNITVTADLDAYPISTGEAVEGLRLEEKVVIRKAGTADTPIADGDGDVVYGKITKPAADFVLSFYSIVGGEETAFIMPADTSIDYKVALRTNMSIIPADAIIRSGGASFVEGATDAKAYLNLNQLMKDLYGGAGTLDNDGNANLATPLVTQISDEASARADADQAIRDDLASTSANAGKGAKAVGVETNTDYTGQTVQAVLNDMGSRITYLEDNGGAEVTATHTRDAASANNYFPQKTGASEFASLEERLVDIETVADAQFKDKETRVTKLETEDDRYAFEATGGETEVYLPSGKKAKNNSLFMSINGAIQAPDINYAEKKNGSNEVVGVDFTPETLLAGDVVFMWWKNL